MLQRLLRAKDKLVLGRVAAIVYNLQYGCVWKYARAGVDVCVCLYMYASVCMCMCKRIYVCVWHEAMGSVGSGVAIKKVTSMCVSRPHTEAKGVVMVATIQIMVLAVTSGAPCTRPRPP